MKYNFDEEIERKGTYSIKYDFAEERHKPENVLPLWVADMDFRSPKEVIDDMQKRCEHGIFGYTDPKGEYFDIVQRWFFKRYNLELEKDWIVVTGGIVFTINAIIRSLTKEGDGVLVQKPVYYPFFDSIKRNKRKVVNNPLVNVNGRYEINFEDFEHKIKTENVKLFLLCSPHNPVGRVWTKEELKKIGEICSRYGVIVVSDEVHSEITFSAEHTPYWLADESFSENSVICTSTGKAFNQAGLQHANIFIKDVQLRRKILRSIHQSGYSNVSIFGLTGCMSAYEFGEEWLEQLTEYLHENLKFAQEYIEKNIPKVKVVVPEGTYLLWIDFKELGLCHAELDHLITEKANLWLDGGTMFGEEGAGYQRLNFATTRRKLEQALKNIEYAVKSLIKE